MTTFPVRLVSRGPMLASVASWIAAACQRVTRERAPSRHQAMLSASCEACVRAAAQDAALRIALGVRPSAANPYAPGSRESTLWARSFTTRLMELETEAFAPAPAVRTFPAQG